MDKARQFWISPYGQCRHLSLAESLCPVTLLQLCGGQLLKAIGMELLLSTHRNILLPGNIWTDFWPCLFTLLPVAWTAAECITTLTITTRVIMNNDEIRISLCRCNSYHLLVLFFFSPSSDTLLWRLWIQQRCCLNFLQAHVCTVHLPAMLTMSPTYAFISYKQTNKKYTDFNSGVHGNEGWCMPSSDKHRAWSWRS